MCKHAVYITIPAPAIHSCFLAFSAISIPCLEILANTYTPNNYYLLPPWAVGGRFDLVLNEKCAHRQGHQEEGGETGAIFPGPA